MTGVGDDSRGRLPGRPWFVAGLALAAAATVALVLASDIRYLRLGIVAALWAALVGAFLAVRYRKQAASTEDAVAQAQEIYELELEREIAARREFELEIESEARQRVDADSRAELDALRAEVGALRQNLQALFGGEVLLERLSLTAQATRMRALREEQRLVESGPGTGGFPALTSSNQAEIVDRPTELIERVREKRTARPAGRSVTPEPRRPERSPEPARRGSRSEPVPERQNAGASPAASVARAAAEARAERTRFQQRATPQPPPKKAESPGQAPPAELTSPGFGGPERGRPARAPEPNVADQLAKLAETLRRDRVPSRESGSRDRPRSDLSAAFANEDDGNRRAARKPAEPPQAHPMRETVAGRPEQRDVAGRGEAGTAASATGVFTPDFTPETERATVPVGRRDPEGPVEPSSDEPANNPMLPEDARRLARQGRPGGRRRRAEDDLPSPEPRAPEGGGRRRRADGEPASWLAPTSGDGGGRRRAGHSRTDSESGSTGSAPRGRRAASDEDETAGSHSEGRSVSELLAAHGSNATPRRRHRADG